MRNRVEGVRDAPKNEQEERNGNGENLYLMYHTAYVARLHVRTPDTDKSGIVIVSITQRHRPVACQLAERPVEDLHQLLQRELDLPECRKSSVKISIQ